MCCPSYLKLKEIYSRFLMLSDEGTVSLGKERSSPSLPFPTKKTVSFSSFAVGLSSVQQMQPQDFKLSCALWIDVPVRS